MTTTSGLTEKNMSNKRFRKTENAIFIAYCKLKDYPTNKKLAKTAKISRATLYRHHKKTQAIPQDYEKYLLLNYARAVRNYLSKESNLRQLILRTLVFIYGNREVFKILFSNDRKEIIKQMFSFLRPSIITKWHLAGDLAKMYNVYANAVLGVIEAWGMQGFPKESIEQVLDDILYLTSIARQSFLPIK